LVLWQRKEGKGDFTTGLKPFYRQRGGCGSATLSWARANRRRQRGPAVAMRARWRPASTCVWCVCHWRMGPRSFKMTVSHHSTRPARFHQCKYFFYLFKLPQDCKIQNRTFVSSKIYQSLQHNRLSNEEQLSFWEDVQIPNRMWIRISGCKLSLNLGWIYLGLKLHWKKFGNFHKILACLNIQEYKFRWPYLYAKILCFYISAFWLGLKIKKKDFEFEFQTKLGLYSTNTIDSWEGTVDTL
jgi:hypothetical protein